MFFARIVLAIQALVMGGFGLAYWLWPYEMANLNGMLLMETVSVSNMRVYYGGLQLGLAIFLLWSMRRPERASPAEGYPAAHAAEQGRIVREGLGG